MFRPPVPFSVRGRRSGQGKKVPWGEWFSIRLDWPTGWTLPTRLEHTMHTGWMARRQMAAMWRQRVLGTSGFAPIRSAVVHGDGLRGGTGRQVQARWRWAAAPWKAHSAVRTWRVASDRRRSGTLGEIWAAHSVPLSRELPDPSQLHVTPSATPLASRSRAPEHAEQSVTEMLVVCGGQRAEHPRARRVLHAAACGVADYRWRSRTTPK